jgi:hypothetical protein
VLAAPFYSDTLDFLIYKRSNIMDLIKITEEYMKSKDIEHKAAFKVADSLKRVDSWADDIEIKENRDKCGLELDSITRKMVDQS